MSNSSLLKMTLLFSIIGSTGYVIGYNYALITTANQENNKDHLTEIATKYETLLDKTQNAIVNTNKQQEDFLANLKEAVQKNCQALNSVTVEFSKNNNVPPAKSVQLNHTNLFNEVAAKIDVKSFNSLLTDTQSTDFNIRRRSLIALALLGSAEIKQEIGKLIENEQEDPALRLDLIKTIDWQGSSSNLLHLLDSTKSEDIKTAAIQAAQNTLFSKEERQIIAGQLEKTFSNESDDLVKINILDYFANTAPEQLPKIIESLPKNGISPAIQEHIDFFAKPSSTEGSG